MSPDNTIISSNATIDDILSTLDDPVEYVRCVLGNMLATKKEFGSALVRIGTTGRGIAPHYRVEPTFERMLDRQEAFFVAFHGRNHKRLDWGMKELRGLHWSIGHLTYDEVQGLLGRLRALPT